MKIWNLPPFGRMYNFAVDHVQGISVAWTLPSLAKYLICKFNFNYDEHYLHDQ